MNNYDEKEVQAHITNEQGEKIESDETNPGLELFAEELDDQADLLSLSTASSAATSSMASTLSTLNPN